jgi:hypothetical protein
MTKILTDKECKAIWEDTSAARPLKLDEIGMQVMRWVEHTAKENAHKKVHNWKSGIN